MAADRPQLKRVLVALERGDACSSRDLLNIMHEVKQAGGAFRSLAEPWVDTSSELGEFMLTVLAAAAKLERATTLSCVAEGRARAKAAGKRRPFSLNPTQRAEAAAMLRDGRRCPRGGGHLQRVALDHLDAATMTAPLLVTPQESPLEPATRGEGAQDLGAIDQD